MDIKHNGSHLSGKGAAEWFTGSVRVDPLFDAPAPACASRVSVTFEPDGTDDDVLFGNVWERPGLSKRDRSLITVAALVALVTRRPLILSMCRKS